MVARIAHNNWSYEMQTLGDEAAGNCSTSGLIPRSTEDDDDFDFENWDGDDDADGREPNSDGSGREVDDSLSLIHELRNLCSYIYADACDIVAMHTFFLEHEAFFIYLC
jgi:hypothetical protein